MNILEKVAIKDLLPNPFRNMEHYKIPEEKIEALIRSFKTNGSWPSVIGRRAGNKVEKAFGHAREEAGRRLYGKNHEIEVIIMDLSDEQMLRMMADENGELWGTDFLVDMETVQATIKAYADGRIQLEAPENKAHIKFGARQTAPYTTRTVAKFLNWREPRGAPQERVGIAIRALELIEEGVLKLEQFEGLGNRNARVLVEEADIAKKRIGHEAAARKQQMDDAEQEVKEAKSHKAKEKAEQKKQDLQKRAEKVAKIPAEVGEAVSTAMKTGKVGYRQARKVTNEITDGRVFKPLPPSAEFIANLRRSLVTVLSPYLDKERMDKIQAVIDAKDILPKGQVHGLAESLVGLSGRCLELAEKLNVEDTHRVISNRVKALPSK